jgi:Reeler domain
VAYLIGVPRLSVVSFDLNFEQPRSMFKFLAIFVAFCIFSSNANSTGAPLIACNDLRPNHTPEGPQTSPSPFTITLSSTTVTAGNPVQVTIAGPGFRGFMIQARNPGGQLIGVFTASGSVQTLNCVPGFPNTATHVNNIVRSSQLITWNSPVNFSGAIRFQ